MEALRGDAVWVAVFFCREQEECVSLQKELSQAKVALARLSADMHAKLADADSRTKLFEAELEVLACSLSDRVDRDV